MIKIICDICGAEAPASPNGSVPSTWTVFNGAIVPPASDVSTVGTSITQHACEKHPDVALRFVERSA